MAGPLKPPGLWISQVFGLMIFLACVPVASSPGILAISFLQFSAGIYLKISLKLAGTPRKVHAQKVEISRPLVYKYILINRFGQISFFDLAPYKNANTTSLLNPKAWATRQGEAMAFNLPFS